MAATTPQQEFNIREYWHILARRRWLIYTCVLVATAAAAVSSFLATPVFKATCTISIERTGVRLLKQDLAASETSWLDYQNFYNTQYKIIESDRVLRQVIDNIGRDVVAAKMPVKPEEDSSVDAPVDAAQARRGPGATAAAAALAAAEDTYYPYLRFLRSGLVISPVKDSHLVEIAFTSSDNKFAAEAANAVAKAYIDFTLDTKRVLAMQSKDFFLGRIEELREQIRKEEDALQAFARENQLVTGDANERALKNYDDLGQRLTAAQGELANASAKYRAYSSADPGSLDEVRTSPLIQGLSSAAAEAERDYREKQASYGAEYPEVRKAKEKMQATLEKLKTETDSMAKQAVDAVRVEYINKKNQVEELSGLFEGSRTAVNKFQGPYNEYLTRKKVVDNKRTTLDELLNGQNQMELSANLNDTGHNVRVIDDAQPPHIIFRPKKKLNIMLGFLFGLFVGIGGAVLMEYIDNTLKTPDDVRQVLALPLLGMIPTRDSETRDQRRRKAGRSARPAAADSPGEIEPALVAVHSPLSPIAEAYRELRTAILLATPGHPPRDLAVTSCQPGEGKTTTAINIAVTLAQLGRKVLLVDTDLRRPRCHHVLRASSARGVSTYLTGNSDFESLIVPTFIERVSLLPAGPIPPNPAELLDAERFRELVSSLRASGQFDHVIFDSPPVLSVVDPLLIGRHVEGTVLVIKSASTSRDSGRLGKEKLLGGRVTLLGVLLNAVSMEHVPYQYRYYRYGYARKKGEGKSEDVAPAAAGGERARKI